MDTNETLVEEVIVRGCMETGFVVLHARTLQALCASRKTLFGALEYARRIGARRVWHQLTDAPSSPLGTPLRLTINS